MYNSEEEFLNNYNSDNFEKISVTSDILIFSVSSEESNNYRKLDKKLFSVLLVKRENYPFKGMWCLPGGFMNIDETSEEAAIRILDKETNLKDIYLEQLYTFDSLNRDPRMRILSTSYMALVDKNKLKNNLSKNASWFNMEIEETSKEINVKLENGIEDIEFVIEKKLRCKTTDRYDYIIKSNDKIAFDHPKVIATGVSRLRNKAEYTDIIFNMMPKLFTVGELMKVYEVILNKKLIDAAFRRTISNKIVATDEIKTGEGHRPSVLYMYKSN